MKPAQDLRGPGPFVWPDAPPALPVLPTSTSRSPPDWLDLDGPALVQHPSGLQYRGSGIEPGRHPCASHPTFGSWVRDVICGHCRSHRVLIIDVTWNVHPYSGDAYWDIESRCTACGGFNRYVGSDA